MRAADGREIVDCIYCAERPAVDDLGYCGYCHWTARAEFEEGFYKLRTWLRYKTELDRWLTERFGDGSSERSV